MNSIKLDWYINHNVALAAAKGQKIKDDQKATSLFRMPEKAERETLAKAWDIGWANKKSTTNPNTYIVTVKTSILCDFMITDLPDGNRVVLTGPDNRTIICGISDMPKKYAFIRAQIADNE